MTVIGKSAGDDWLASHSNGDAVSLCAWKSRLRIHISTIFGNIFGKINCAYVFDLKNRRATNSSNVIAVACLAMIY